MVGRRVSGHGAGMVRTAVAMLATSVVLVAFSESFYYDETEALTPALALWYAVPTAAFVWMLRRFAVGSLAGLVLAGAVYGFVVEGVLVTELYSAPLFTISYTPLAWHMLVSVLVGFWAVAVALRHERWWYAPAVAVGVGVLLGAWWPAWGPRDPAVLTLELLEPTVALAVGHAVLGLVPLPTTRPSRLVTAATALVIGGLFVVGPLLSVPWAPLLLGPLLALCWYGLRREAAATAAGAPSTDADADARRPGDPGPPVRTSAAGPLLTRLRAPVRFGRLAWLALVPVTAGAVYAVARPLAPDDAQALVGAPQLLLGYIAFAWAVTALTVQARTSSPSSDNVTAGTGSPIDRRVHH